MQKVGSAIIKNPGKALKHGVSAIGNVIKNPIKTIKHGVGALVHGGKALLTNRVKCNGHVWGHLDGTDIQTDVYFTPGPKLAMRDSKVSIRNLHVDWKFDKLCGHAAGLGSILVGGKKKVVGMLKNVIQKLVDSKIRQVENMLVEKINAHPIVNGILGICNPQKLNMLLTDLFNSPLLGNAFAVVPFVPENIPEVDDRQAKCLMKTLKSLTSIVNIFIPPLKPTLLGLLKSQAFSLPSISGLVSAN